MHAESFPPYEVYLKHWKAELIPLLGWTEYQVEQWAQRFEKYFDGGVHEFHRRGPLMYVADELIPASFLKPYQHLIVDDLTWTFENILGDFVEEVGDIEKLPHADWQSVQDQIDTILRRHGATFENVVREKASCYRDAHRDPPNLDEGASKDGN